MLLGLIDILPKDSIKIEVEIENAFMGIINQKKQRIIISNKEIILEALNRHLADRLFIVNKFVESFNPMNTEIEKKWLDEVTNRKKLLDTGKLKTISYNEFSMKIKGTFHQTLLNFLANSTASCVGFSPAMMRDISSILPSSLSSTTSLFVPSLVTTMCCCACAERCG